MVRNYSFAKVSFKTYPAIGCNIDDFDSAVPGSSKQGCASRRDRKIYAIVLVMIFLIAVGSSCYYCYLDASKEEPVVMIESSVSSNSSLLRIQPEEN